ncbi:MAG: DUF2231 domain-containing protein [Candidatus Eisenbacteria bacterium]
MQLLPPFPSFSGLHPLVVHFPIALLLVAPLLVVAAMAWRTLQRGLLVAALALMVVGTAATWLAVATGAEAGEKAEQGGARIEAVVEQHEELAETTRNVFTLLTLVFAALVFAPSVLKRGLDRMPLTAAHAVFLVLYAGGAIFLVNTAHQGGRIVHEFGVRAEMTAAQTAGGMTMPGESGEEEGGEGEARESATRGVGTAPAGDAASPAGSPAASPARPNTPAGGESAGEGDHVAATSRP